MAEEDRTCFVCNKTFAVRSSLLVHVRKFHGIDTGNLLKRGITCDHPDCKDSGTRYLNTDHYRQHLHDVHHIEDILLSHQYTFKNLSDFMEWKTEQEKVDVAQFNARHGQVPRARCVVYNCSRSGSFSSSSRGRRRLKSQGSKKCGCRCPASVVLRETGETFRVTYYPTHYGHDKDARHLSLTQEDKLNIADHLLSGLPTRQIINKFRSSAAPERVSLVTMRDIDNIKLSYKPFIKLTTSKKTGFQMKKKQTKPKLNESVDDSTNQFVNTAGLPLTNSPDPSFTEPVAPPVLPLGSVKFSSNHSSGTVCEARVPRKDQPRNKLKKRSLMTSHIQKLLGDIGSLVDGVQDDEPIGPTVIAMLTNLKRLLLKRRHVPARSPSPCPPTGQTSAVSLKQSYSDRVTILRKSAACSGVKTQVKAVSLSSAVTFPGNGNAVSSMGDASVVASMNPGMGTGEAELIRVYSTTSVMGTSAELGRVYTAPSVMGTAAKIARIYTAESVMSETENNLLSTASGTTATLSGTASTETSMSNPSSLFVPMVPMIVDSLSLTSKGSYQFTGRPPLPPAAHTSLLLDVPPATQICLGASPINGDTTAFIPSSSSSYVATASEVSDALPVGQTLGVIINQGMWTSHGFGISQ